MCTLVLVDDHSKYVYVQPLLQKSHAFPKLKMIVSYLETQMGKSLKAIQSDQGTEWRSNDTLEWTHDKGIEWQMTVGYNSRQNGCAERMNRSLGEKMQTLLMQRRLPKRFWPYAIWAAAFKMNLAPSVNNEFPYQAMFGKSLEQLMRLLHMFRCLAWVDIPKSGEERMAFLQPRLQSKYILEQLLLADEGDLNDLRYTDENLFDEREEEQLDEYMDMETIDGTDEEKTSGKGVAKMIEHRADAETWANSTHFGPTAIDNGIKNLDPTISKALSGEDRKHWEEAMCKELDGLRAMGTWEIADLPQGMNAVDTHWVLKIKTDANLILTKFKARLVARGFTQREGINYTEEFTPVAPIQSIQGVLAIATMQGWEVDCIDVKQVYLNSTLHHDVFLKLLVGMKVPPGKALKLVKGLYELKQSGQEWNIELDSHLQKIGFHCMLSVLCLYSRGTGGSMTVITAYVDDMLIVSPSHEEVNCTKKEIMAKW
ncbi:uncharacterized protein UHO2_00187 [Ustilago hordei]|uniref:uncharacterized protein n=1 Tax=Ustilago hordei TaxID=120017 RepID=UPI001A5FD795|nr:uncharacterized protein UHO2_00187 [Ustilago hordei]SYW81683.1 uncharacterized protein UHO2_00187 [Ustilago hordei]